MSYPTANRYNEAVQAPQLYFSVPEVRQRKVKEDGLGLPEVLSGGFAFTYKFVGAGGNIAVRCFHKEISNIFRRYQEISSFLSSAGSPFFVKFAFFQSGVNLDQESFPVVIMDWVEGDTLLSYIERHRVDPQIIGRLRQQLLALSEEQARLGYAHGDIQHRNIIVDRSGALKLVDYDGMYVPALARLPAADFGHPHFQHPLRGATDFGPTIDRFPLIVLDLSLAALQQKASLFEKYCKGEYLILQRQDFLAPEQSAVLSEVAQIASLTGSVSSFCNLCTQNPLGMPTLKEFRQRNSSGQLGAVNFKKYAPTGAPRPPYTSPYEVVDGMDYSRARMFLGKPVELIGIVQKIVPANGGLVFSLRFGASYSRTPTVVVPGDTYAKLFAKHPEIRSGAFWVSATGVLREHSYRSNTTIQVFAREVSDVNMLSGEDEAHYRLGQDVWGRPLGSSDVPSWMDGNSHPHDQTSHQLGRTSQPSDPGNLPDWMDDIPKIQQGTPPSAVVSAPSNPNSWRRAVEPGSTDPDWLQKTPDPKPRSNTATSSPNARTSAGPAPPSKWDKVKFLIGRAIGWI
jgi:serine/threonine protein kinase